MRLRLWHTVVGNHSPQGNLTKPPLLRTINDIVIYDIAHVPSLICQVVGFGDGDSVPSPDALVRYGKLPYVDKAACVKEVEDGLQGYASDSDKDKICFKAFSNGQYSSPSFIKKI